MAFDGPVSFFLSRSDRPVTPGSDVWRRPLPLTRDRCCPAIKTDDPVGSPIRFGDYFDAVKRFLLADGCGVLRVVLKALTGSNAEPERVASIRVFLEKHGEFYHPSRVAIRVDGRSLNAVVNVAVSPSGRQVIEEEVHHLGRLRREFGRRFTPAVYAFDRVRLPQGRELPMFVGEWYSEYHEFHASASPAESVDDGQRLVVWDTAQGPFFLSPRQSRTVFRRAAAILTYFYNPLTFERIFSWHHAAGDFILRRTGPETVCLRLITVRRYAPLFTGVAVTGETILEGMILFLLNLSIRNRLDRADGVGDLVWWGDAGVSATVEGFWDAMEMKAREDDLPMEMVLGLKRHLAAYSEEELFDTAAAMVARYDRGAPELPLIQRQLPSHISALQHAIQQSFSGS